MQSPEHKGSLPRVEEADLLRLAVEELSDPLLRGWWQEFASENAVLAREVLRRAYYDSQNTDQSSSLETQRRIISSVAFAIHALKIAAKRIGEMDLLEEQAGPSEAIISGDGDGVVPQP